MSTYRLQKHSSIDIIGKKATLDLARVYRYNTVLRTIRSKSRIE